MAITKQKKEEIIKESAQDIESSKALIFADFTGSSVSDISELRAQLREVNSKLKVVKKTLMGVLFKDKGIDVDPLEFEGPVGTIFVGEELSEAAGPLYRFSKDHEGFKLLGAFRLDKKEQIDEATINAIGSLPPKNVLLGQVVGTIAAPLRALVYILSEKSKG